MAKKLPRQFHFHQTATISQRHIWPRLYHVNTTFTKLPPFYNVTHGHESTTSIPLSPNCHLLVTLSRVAKKLPRQFHFHQTATISQRHIWPRLYHVNTTFTKLPPSCNVVTRGKEATTSIPLSPNCHHLATLSRTATNLPRQFHFHQTATILQRHTWPRIYHVNITFTKLPPSRHIMVTALPRQCHFHLTATS